MMAELQYKTERRIIASEWFGLGAMSEPEAEKALVMLGDAVMSDESVHPLFIPWLKALESDGRQEVAEEWVAVATDEDGHLNPKVDRETAFRYLEERFKEFYGKIPS